jgi:pimeloyl-ACP methyl ester carboxylesterase
MSSLNYELGGTGPLLHPIGLDLSFPSPVASILRQEFTVLTLDQRGHGESRMSVPMSSLEDYADDLHTFLYEINFAPTAIAGFSFGGMVAMVSALKYPQAVSALAICACTATQTAESRAIAWKRGDDARHNGMADVLEATLDRWFTALFARPARSKPCANDFSRTIRMVGRPRGTPWATSTRCRDFLHCGRTRQIFAGRTADSGRHPGGAFCRAPTRAAYAVHRTTGRNGADICRLPSRYCSNT